MLVLRKKKSIKICTIRPQNVALSTHILLKMYRKFYGLKSG